MRLLPSVVAGCALTLTVGACSPDDPPTPTPTTAAPEPANPDATPPPLPDQAAQFTPNGLSAFARYYLRAVGAAGRSGDTATLRELSDPDCTGCQKYVDYFDSLENDGGRIDGQEWTATRNSQVRFDRRKNAESYVTTTISISAGSIRKTRDSEPQQTLASNDKVTLALRFDDGWSVTQFGSGGFE